MTKSYKMSISGGREIGFELEHIALMLTMRKCKPTGTARIALARIEKLIEGARK
jgi:hypothetical protein